MKYFWGFLGGIALSAAALSLLLACFGETKLITGIQAFGSVAIAFSAAVAYRLFRSNTVRHVREDERNESHEYLNESKEILERMYTLFSAGENGCPEADREIWLTAARMILRYKRFKEKISEKDHIDIAEEAEDYIRIQLYRLLERNRDNFTDKYFFADREDRRTEGIDRDSIAVVFQFSRWPDGATDLMDEVDGVELFARGAVPINFLGVENYLGHFQDYWERVQERRQELRNTDA